MKKHAMGLAVCAATFFVLGSSVSWAESASTQKAGKGSVEKKHGHAHKCKECGKSEKDCACDDKKHDDKHESHAHDEAESKSK